jgi:UDP-N-acetylglucosamine 3-dehydrogenase
MGRRHVRVLRGLPEHFVLTGIVDPDRATHEPGLPVYGSEAEAIDDAEVVVVATPIPAHAQTVLRALARGRHVFVEKPMGATRSEVEAMAEAAEASGAGLFVGHSERFNPVVRALRKLVMPETIRAIHAWRVGSPRARGRDVLLNLGVHDLDLAAYLTQSTVLPRASLGCEETADLALTARAGCPVDLHVAREGERERNVVVETDDTTYYGDLLRFRLSAVSREGVSKEITLEPGEPLVLQAQALARAIAGESAEIADGADGARAVIAAEKSLSLFPTEGSRARASQRERRRPQNRPLSAVGF